MKAQEVLKKVFIFFQGFTCKSGSQSHFPTTVYILFQISAGFAVNDFLGYRGTKGLRKSLPLVAHKQCSFSEEDRQGGAWRNYIKCCL